MNNHKPVFEKPEISIEELNVALYNATQKLTHVNLELKESERKRLEMFSNLSHDLRSPITTIKSYIEYLLSFDQLNEQEVRDTLNLMNGKIHLLDHMMNELLTITTLDAQSPDSIQPERIQLGMFLEDFFYSIVADQKYSKRNLFLNVPEHFPYYASIEPKLFYRVLDNLFNNALKYSHDDDCIELNAYCQNQEIIIVISDTGIGIDESKIPKIFERTYMVSDARTPSPSQGCGLGLSIAESIIEKHHGRIWCESTVGTGSKFFIAIPQVE